jgi:sulfopyruvate decarboxylase alpha subunit
MPTTVPSWPDMIFDALRAQEVRQVAYVPDAGHKELIERCIAEDDMETVPLTTEEEGVALLAGAWLGGQRGVLLMQSSGVGNCINMLSLTRTCRFPLLALVTMRGEAGEFNPWQEPMGQITGPVLELAGCQVVRLETPASAGETVAQAARTAHDGLGAVAVLIAQRMVGIKSFED